MGGRQKAGRTGSPRKGRDLANTKNSRNSLLFPVPISREFGPFGVDQDRELVIACGRELGLDLINVVVWVKTNGGQGSLWRSRHELLPVFKKGGEPHVNNVELGRHGRWRSNVWEYAGASSLGSDSREGLALHPTVKPRLLLEDASSTSRTAATSSSTASRVRVRR